MTPRATTSPDPNAAIVESLPALLVGVDWQNLLDSGTRGVLERQALRPFLQRQRWFASKARDIRQVRITDWTPLRAGLQPSFLAVVSIEYTDGWTESYVVPMALVTGDAAETLLKTTASAVLARITGARKGVIVDGMYDDATCDLLLKMVERGDDRATRLGVVHGVSTSRDDDGRPPIEPPAERRWVRGPLDQSNSVAFLAGRYVLKLFRRIEPAPNPEFEIGRFLTEHRFTRTPALVGALEYQRPGLEPGTLSVVQTFVNHQGSAWEFAVDELRRYYERVGPRANHSEPENRGPADTAEGQDALAPPPLFVALEHWYLASATTLGQRTAEMHLTLASGTEPAFRPETLDGTARMALAGEMGTRATEALDLLDRRLATLSDSVRELASAVLEARSSLLARFTALESGGGGLRIRVHGDYHLGQVLRTEEDFIILDFEGEPARSIAERRAKQSPLKDVAGMLRSFSYATYAALFASTVHAPDDYPALEPWADTWQHWVSDAFWKGYAGAVAGSPLLPRDTRPLLAAFMLDKALYELSYELNNRPDWVRIPLIGIRKLIGSSW
jgi:maltose alpha-D-glucosyltransferase/alpha-amylase